jgi:hypothetical protein
MSAKNHIVVLAAVFALMLFFGAASVVKASLQESIDVQDSGGNSIVNKAVPVGTIITIIVSYGDPTTKAKASASLDEYYGLNSNSITHVANLFTGVVNNGYTNKASYVLSNVGYYEFRWTCAENLDSPGCTYPANQNRAGVFTVPGNKVPEPAPYVGLSLGSLALGLFFVKRKNVKPAKRD